MSIPGTNSTAIQNQDGTWDVLDVPIVHEGVIPRYTAAGEHVDDFPVTVDWMRECIVRAARREREGYMGRGFVDHHDGGSSSQADAGFLRPRRITTIKVDGQQVRALAADLVAIPDDVYRSMVKTGRVPYRSIESLHAESGFIDGVALMPTRPPHFQLPMLTIAHERALVATATDEALGGGMALVACESADRAKTAAARYSMFPSKPNDAPIKAMDDEAPKQDDAPEAKGEESSDKIKLSDIDLGKVEATAEEWGSFLATVKGIYASLSGGDSSDESDSDGSTEQVPEQAAASATTSHETVKAYDPATEARLAAAEAQLATIKADRERDDLISEIDRDLSDKNIGTDRRAVLRAQFDKGGPEGLRAFAAAVKDYAPNAVTGDPDDVGGAIAHATPTSPEVEEYADPADRAAALKAEAEWNDQAAAGWPMDGRDKKATIRRAVMRARAGN